ncbi:MAG: hypothetical protein ACYTGB_15000 [Planctomycetota bacterium]|jgi:hypothetical protein
MLTKTKTVAAVLLAAILGVLHAAAPHGLAGEAAGAGKNTELGKLAASLKPGEMKELRTEGYTFDLIKSWYDWDHDAKGGRVYGARKMFNIFTGGWANDGKWDPKTRRVLYFGGGHYASFKFVTYSADSNAWKVMPVPVWCDPRIEKTSEKYGWARNGWMQDEKTGKKRKCWPRGHTYDCNAIWPEKRLYVLTMWNWMRFYDLDKDEWKPSAPDFRGDAMGPCEAFPELGGFVAFPPRGGQLRLYDPDTGKRRELGQVSFGLHGVMEYNPVHKVLVVGGGDVKKAPSKDLYLVNKEGKVKKLKPPPVWLRCTPTAKLICDPTSGEYVIQEYVPGKDKGKAPAKARVFAFHPLRDEWKEIPGLRLPEGVAVPINTHGVVMICTAGKKEGLHCFLYRHKPVFAD